MYYPQMTMGGQEWMTQQHQYSTQPYPLPMYYPGWQQYHQTYVPEVHQHSTIQQTTADGSKNAKEQTLAPQHQMPPKVVEARPVGMADPDAPVILTKVAPFDPIIAEHKEKKSAARKTEAI